MWIHVLILTFLYIFKASSKGTSNLFIANNSTVSVIDPVLLDTNSDSGTTHVAYGSEGIITCDIKSSVPINIHWYYADETTGKINQIVPSDKYGISTNGTELRIKNMDLDMVGKYICTAAYSQKVRIVLTAPEITGKTERRAIKGSNVVLECKIIKGLPKPKITWEYMDQTVSKFTHIPSSGNVLRLASVADKNAGRYKCVAENIAGKDEHVTTLVIESPPKIVSKSFAIFEGFERDKSLKIPCDVVGIPIPVITWIRRGNVIIIPNEKYSIEKGSLIIKNLTEEDATFYTCEAKNYIGSVNASFEVRVKMAPRITGKTEKRSIRGSNVAIECKIIKGFPKPKITWQYMDQTVSKFTLIHSSGNVLRLSSVAEKNAGRYKCIAENVAGKDEHVTKLVIEFRPRMITKPSTVYKGLVGDMALRIPCNVVGIPKPVNTWKINGNLIKPNDKYFIEDGALIIMNPVQKDSASYTCEANNYLGSVNATFLAEVEELINSLKIKSRYVYILKDETRKLQCEGYNSTSQTVRWFIEDVEVHSDQPYLEVVKAGVFDDGNYTCRVNDKHGNTHTYSYVVDVGYPPHFYQQISLTDWRGDPADILSNCDSTAKPQADVYWKFNSQALTSQNITEVGDTLKWGNFKCNVTNVHGSVQRSFDVQSSACFVNRKFENIKNMPLLLSDELTYPDWAATKYDLIIEQGDKITLYCPRQNGEPLNTFQNFPRQRELEAFCHKQDEFLVSGKIHTLSDLLCSNNVQPTVVRDKTKCLTETSELMRVGYNVADFLENCEVCYDHSKNMPLFTRASLTETDGIISIAHDWYASPGIENAKLNTGFTCKHSNSTCCYDKTQLVDPRDFQYSSAKKSTFFEFLNTVPYWRPCANSKKTTWKEINEMVRSRLPIYTKIVAWSGTHTFQDRDGAIVPRYLWKVLVFDEDESVAIIHVNDPSPTSEDIKCENISSRDDDDWFISRDEFTYCCTVPSFVAAFDMHGIDFSA